MTNATYYTVLTVFAIAVYFIVTDENAARMVSLRLAWVPINVKRWWFIVTRKPRIMYDGWKIRQHVKKIRKEHGLPNEDKI